MKTEGVGFYSRVGLYWSGYGILTILQFIYAILRASPKLGFELSKDILNLLHF